MVRNTHFHRFFKDALSSQGPIEKDIVLSSDADRFLNAHGTALRDSAGKQIGALIVLNDVTRIQRLENIRREFVANISHEIKTPITAIKGFVETLRDGSVKNTEDAERFLDICNFKGQIFCRYVIEITGGKRKAWNEWRFLESFSSVRA